MPTAKTIPKLLLATTPDTESEPPASGRLLLEAPCQRIISLHPGIGLYSANEHSLPCDNKVIDPIITRILKRVLPQ